MKNALTLTGCLLLTLAVGGVSGFFTMHEITTWYAALHKPFFNPPNYLFGPVWTLLYVLMGISFYLILKQPPSTARRNVIAIFIVQLTLNFFWSIIFFNLHCTGVALGEVALMWVAILWMIILFYPISKTAALLQLPYIAWVSFAAALNAAIFCLN